MTFAPPSAQPVASSPGTALDDDTSRRRELLGKLRDDRQDLVRVAGIARDLAETFEVAQGSLVIMRRSLRWLALIGGVAALTVSVRTGRRPPALLLAGLSLVIAERWFSHPVRRELARADRPVVVGPAAASVRIHPIAPPEAARSGGL
ncbi:MAG: hypothetical protein K0Q76_3180 [Panacagrimonas sp.]|nr:hypothetical protein [Panacagrimonas sp.]MCC2658072.1 hypothetical protein [Panacagrimonas sp.]